jgi:hypothetical protein
MPHLFRPYADTIARSVLLAILVVPFLAIGLGYCNYRWRAGLQKYLSLELQQLD